jgi:hypothetical protein
MSELTTETLAECLELICSIHQKECSALMLNLYHDRLSDLDDSAVSTAFGQLLDDRYFPTPARIREVVTGVLCGADWFTIVAVANGSKRTATIAGISAVALIQAVAGAGVNQSGTNSSEEAAPSSVCTALRKLAFCDDPFALGRIRKDWDRLVSVPVSHNTLAPADVEISLTPKQAIVNREYPVDYDYRHRTASLIRCIKDKGSVSVAWMPFIESLPANKKLEVMTAIKEMGFVTPAVESSSAYKKYLSVGEAMRAIDESEIGDIIASARTVRASVKAFAPSAVVGQQQSLIEGL